MDADIMLPADTLAILNEFLLERSKRKVDEENQVVNQTGIDAEFEEDWQLSQFWYNSETKLILRDVVVKLLDEQRSDLVGFHIALLSCPSLYKDIRNIHDNVRIFEYDPRFEAYGTDFVFYDLNCVGGNPNYLKEHHQQYDIIVADPPFLSQECIAKTCEIITRLQRNQSESKIIICSGEVTEPWLTTGLPVLKCGFRPEHDRNLGNSFVSYANFNLDEYIENK
ncbi:protein-lysine N-methyltransferase CG9154 [Drosophila biarmipes]|uniref:protein-lysine N-methyltransferase CG9154 n=1 Tax=Drosophila biarmipes TaxID=125945 RepID=UPI0007E897BD|nr:protein-lysine N-methyltransferase CG9154 [Drosophila biarmipes]